MQFEWDERKAASNLSKHGVSFAVAIEFDWANAHVVEDRRKDYGETRFVAYGRTSAGIGHVIVFTPRGQAVRIITVRKFGRKEVEIYGPQAE